MADSSQHSKQTFTREALLFLGLLLTGFLVLPGLVYLVGNAIFGDYGGSGLSAFYREIQDKLWAGETAAWFLVLSPYLVWQLLRLTFHAFRAAGDHQQ
jgi:hypothetical protein